MVLVRLSYYLIITFIITLLLDIIKDRLEAVLNYGLNSCMKATSSDCPLLFTDSNVEDLKSKVEVCFV